jgi:hypothetical protein
MRKSKNVLEKNFKIETKKRKIEIKRIEKEQREFGSLKQRIMTSIFLDKIETKN